jgi:hypothetical protein
MTSEAPDRWSTRKLAVLFYPFSAAAVAINVYFIGLMWQAIGIPAITPVVSLIVSVPLGVPATWLIAKWIRGLMDEADRPVMPSSE